MSKFNARRICRIALLAAMYFLLNMVEIRTPGNLHITFDALPVVVGALLLGPVDAVLIAMFGELLNQIISPYGITATTLLWLIPPMLRGLMIGLAALRGRRLGRPLEHRPAACYAVCVAAAVATTAANTAVIWIDSVLYGYYTFALVFGSALIRFVTGMITAVLVATVAMPLSALLRRQMLERWA